MKLIKIVRSVLFKMNNKIKILINLDVNAARIDTPLPFSDKVILLGLHKARLKIKDGQGITEEMKEESRQYIKSLGL